MNLFADLPATIAAESRQLSEPLQCACVQSAAGTLLVARSGSGIVLMDLREQPLAEAAVLQFVKAQFPGCPVTVAPMTLAALEQQPLHLVGTPFQCRVWRALLAIPAGATRHYHDIARTLDSGARAVGSAVARNRIALRIPCHRVVPVSGGYGQYRWGAARKARLLASEGAPLAA